MATGVDSTNVYGVYAPYASKINVLNTRHEKVFYRIRWINMWGSAKQVIFLGAYTSALPISGTVGLWGESYRGISAYEVSGTSDIFETVGSSGFQPRIKITRMTNLSNILFSCLLVNNT